MSTKSTKNTKTFDEDPPPYTAQSPEPVAATASAARESSTVITFKHHKPAHLWNAQGCQTQRPGPVNETVLDAVRLPDLFASLQSEIQQRAAQRFSVSIIEVERGGKLAYRPYQDEAVSEKAKKRAKGVMAVDSKNWETVGILLAQGKGSLTFEVEDVPIGWTMVKAKSKAKAKPEIKEKSKTKGKKKEEQKKEGTCAVM